ncbi:hypothetical protein GCM10011402_24850 [Paracoccus acridae]|uniref:Uncharacterized protein n=1 Tax=Paracoccus acridae TaxID=1795310 RepID=A0ABQ1VKC1_9RHOB|nr:hypothetical protein GCM10011402_24850 [Paracoccus acridae]
MAPGATASISAAAAIAAGTTATVPTAVPTATGMAAACTGSLAATVSAFPGSTLVPPAGGVSGSRGIACRAVPGAGQIAAVRGPRPFIVSPAKKGPATAFRCLGCLSAIPVNVGSA